MDYFQVLSLSLVQGLTEFLPVSSSGHLVLLQKFFGFAQAPILFDILVHVGTLGAVFVYFRRELFKLLAGFAKGEGESFRVFGLVLAGTIPAVLAGLFFNNQIESAFNSLPWVGLFFLITAVLLFSTKFAKVGEKKLLGKENNNQLLKWPEVFFVGLFQALAILPGVSRSGSTIVAGLWQGAEREAAFRLSFYLAIPAILGALVLKSQDLIMASNGDVNQGLVGMVLAGIVGYFALMILESTLKSARFWYFGVYCLALGFLILLLS